MIVTCELHGCSAVVACNGYVTVLQVPASARKADCPPDFGPNAGPNWNRPYYMTTSDFSTFGPPKLLFQVSESVIDAFLFRAHGRTCAP